MREMKDSGIKWIGEVPNDWRIVRNKNAFVCNKELVGEKSELTQLLSLTTRGIKKKDINNAEGKLPESFDTYQFVNKNDIVMCLFDLDCSAVFSGISPFDGMISPAYRVLSCKESMEARYADYWFRYISDGRKFNHYAKNIRYTLSYEEFSALPLLLPEKSEQRRIADYLDRKCSQIDAIIARQQEVIEKLKAYKLSVITEAVTSTDSQMCRFRNCITTIEQGWSPAPAEIVGEEGWFVLSLSAVKNGKFIKLSKKPIDANENIPTKLSIKVGDLLMTRSNTRELVGDVCLVDSDCPKTIFSDLIYRISLNDTLLPCYAIFLLQSAFIRQQIQESARGSSGTMPKISHKSIKNLNIYLPSIPEQREISGFLRNKCNCIDTCIQEKERLIKKLTAYKKSLIYEVVTGKKEA